MCTLLYFWREKEEGVLEKCKSGTRRKGGGAGVS
jgi:hypothetical protein